MNRVTVRGPASISTLGPGFDCLGVAVRLYNLVRVERTARPCRMPKVFDDAAKRFFKQSRARPFAFSCSVSENVPRSRGLGSSATVRLGLLHGLNALSGSGLNRDVLFQLCSALEGHPDNAAPASFGGFTVARSEVVQRFDVSSRLKFVLLIPEHEVVTSKARRILPPNIKRTSAVKSCGDACAITAAFVSRNYRLLHGNFADQLHQPFRAKLIPYLPRVIKAAEDAGALGAFLSGSGSTICALALEESRKVSKAMVRAIGRMPARAVVLSADNHGVRLTQHKA
jgi:homoserine kinase